MASFHTRQREPLLDRKTQDMVEKRGRELLGLLLIGVGLVFGVILATYSPSDPGWMVATDEPAQNMFGRAGAAVASTLIIILGLGSWSIPAVSTVWGLRFLLHKGQERAVSRAIFAWVLVIAASAYAATHVPGDTWVHSFGLGGLLGDTILGAMLGMAPMAASTGLIMASVLLAVGLLATATFTLGFEKEELRAIGRFLFVGTVLLYNGLVQLLQLAGLRAAEKANGLGSRLKERAEARRSVDEVVTDPRYDAPPALRADPRTLPPVEPVVPEAVKGLRARVENLIRRPTPTEPTLPFEALPEEPLVIDQADHGPGEERIRARISDAIKAKARAVQQPQPVVTGRAEPPVMRSEIPVAPAVSRAVAGALARQAAAQAAVPVVARAAVAAVPPPVPMTPVAPAPVPSAPMRLAVENTATLSFAEEPMGWDDVRLPDFDDLEDAPAPIPAAGRVISRGSAPQVDTRMAALDIEDDLSGWEDEPEMTAAQALLVDAVDDDEDDGFDAWSAAAAVPTPAVAAPMAPAPRAPEPVPEPRRAAEPRPVATRAFQPEPRSRHDDRPALEYEAPPLDLLADPSSIERHHLSDDALEENARMLENVLDDYGVKGEIVSVRPGPVVTMYELEPAPGLKASRVIGLADDIARSMSALSARVSTVPGRSVIGIELPNLHREKVVLREIITARDFVDQNMRLPLALGKDIGGEPIIANLAKMPHLLIAGTTGSGKSVAINTMILSLLYKLTPEECRLIMIDPKMLELSVYDGIPHLLSPVVTDPKKAVVALKWVVGEMEERYRKMSKMGVRNIEGYNGRVREALSKGEMFKRTIQTGFDEETGDPVFETDEFEPQPFPYIVVIVDEMADLMMVAGKEIEACIQRLAQMARASGIHLIMATQRPSVDVITGTIKANFPTRISFQVTSKIDSRTILGEMGAEQLLGMGDMLYMAGGGRISRIHGPFVSDEEVEEIVRHLKSFGPPTYMSGVVEGPDEDKADDIDQVLGLGGGENSEDALYDQAVAIVARDRKCSTSYIQRKLGIGYQKAARLVEQMEDQGVVSAANHVGKREILLPEH